MRKHREKGPPVKKNPAGLLKYLYAAFLVFTLATCSVQPVMAATVWEKASRNYEGRLQPDCPYFHHCRRSNCIRGSPDDEFLQIRKDRR